MRNLPYDEREARQLLPLLESIGNEILERQAAIRTLEDHAPMQAERAAFSAWSAEIAVERRELRKALEELERLGCSLVARRPMTFRIPRLVAEGRRSFLWQGGELLVY